jgi:hypothetical protein
MSELPPIDPTVREGYGPERDRGNYSIGEWIVETRETTRQVAWGESVNGSAVDVHHIRDELDLLVTALIMVYPELRADLQHAVDTHPNSELHEDLLRIVDTWWDELDPPNRRGA